VDEPQQQGARGRGAWWPLVAVLVAACAVYVWELPDRGWYAEDYNRTQTAARYGPLEAARRWFGSENGRLDVWVQWSLHQLRSPQAVHLATLGMHLGNVALLYALALRLVGARGAWLAALLFAVHPQGARTVLWASNACYLAATAACLGAAHLACVRGRRFWLAHGAGAALLGLGLAVHEQGVVAAPLFALLAIRGGEYGKRRPWAGAGLYALAGLGAVGLQRALSHAGKAHALSFANLPAKMGLQLGQALERSVSPGVRTTLLPLLRGELDAGAGFLAVWAVGGLAAACAAWLAPRGQTGSQGEIPRNRDLLDLAGKGLLVFLAGYAIGAFAPHPYLVKRMFYLPSVGWALAAACLALLAARGARRLTRGAWAGTALLALAGVGFAFVSAPVVLREAEYFARGTRLQRAAQAALADGETAAGALLLGVDHRGVYLPGARQGFGPRGVPAPGSVVLARTQTGFRRVGALVVDTGEEGSPRTVRLDGPSGRALEVVHRRLQAPSADRPLARVGADLALVDLEVTAAHGVHATVALALRAGRPLAVDQVFPRVAFACADGTVRGPATRSPARPVTWRGEPAYRHVIETPLPTGARVRELIVRFVPVAVSAEQARVHEVTDPLAGGRNSIRLDLTSGAN